MIKSVLSATILSLLLASSAWAIAPSIKMAPTSNIVDVGYNKGHYNKGYYKHHNYNYAHKNYRGRYHYANRYWGHRYYVRPYNWQTIGCIAVGPVWYCP
jgi:hypothetical protein